MNGLENHEDSLNNAIAHSVLKINPKVSFFDASKASKKSFKITKKKPRKTHCLKITQNVAFNLLMLAFSANFWPIKSDLSGNAV